MIQTMYADHVQQLMQRCGSLLEQEGFDGLLIHSGRPSYHFLDDYTQAYKPNPHFVHWVPFLADYPDGWLFIVPDRKPVLAIYSPDDFWHITPEMPNEFWCEHFDIRLYSDRATVLKEIMMGKRIALIAEQLCEVIGSELMHNPTTLMQHLHYYRAYKTPWEQACIREANRTAVKGHHYLAQAFEEPLSEYQLHQGYLTAIGHQEGQLPYNNIIGLNEHAAVLHYQHKSHQPPSVRRTLLADAGAVYQGYVADITRTISQGSHLFHYLIEQMDIAQQLIVAEVKPGVSFVALHEAMHRRLFTILVASGIVRQPEQISSADALAITRTFYPHGLGHLLGIQVHDIGGWQTDLFGSQTAPPENHPYLRLTRNLEADFVVTIEPGLYFIPSLLGELKQHSVKGHIDWHLVEQLTPWGGIRIEDNVCVLPEGVENYTRDAFNALQ